MKSCENCLIPDQEYSNCWVLDKVCDKYLPDYPTLERENAELKGTLKAYKLLYETEKTNHNKSIDENCKKIRESETSLNNACVTISESTQALERACETIAEICHWNSCRHDCPVSEECTFGTQTPECIEKLVKYFKEATK